MMALNAKLKIVMALNTKLKIVMALNAKLKSDDGSERQNWEVMKMAQNVNEDVMMALNVETEDATLNVDLKTDDGSERQN